jgi:hypothetical protein
MGLRRWLRRMERDAREAVDTTVLVDGKTGEEFEVPKDAFLHVMASFGDEAPEPQIAEILDCLDRLVYRETGEPFWLEDMTHTGRTAANEE